MISKSKMKFIKAYKLVKINSTLDVLISITLILYIYKWISVCMSFMDSKRLDQFRRNLVQIFIILMDRR